MGGARTVAVDPAERSHLLDGLRGLALLGILIVNMVGFIGFGFLEEAKRATTIGHAFDDISELLIEWLVTGKFYSIFSLLFGIGFAIQIGRLEARGEGTARYVRRLFVLFLIGLAHLLLMWFGDILALYALMGAVLLLFRKSSDRTLLGWAAALWLVPIAWSALIHLGGVNPAQPIFQQAMATLTAFGIDPEADPLTYYRTTGFIDQLAVHPADLLFRIADLTYQMRFTKVLAMFLIGLWVGRRALHADPAAHRPLIKKVAAFGLGAGLPLSFARASIDMMATETPWTQLLVETLYCLSTPTLALGYAAGAALLWASGRRRMLEWAAPAGRMALTNYLMQSVLQGLIFYGWWLGLSGRFGLVFVFPFALATFALQLLYSRWWLARFRFGPVEWLWRSLTYGSAQPMRRQSFVIASAAGPRRP